MADQYVAAMTATSAGTATVVLLDVASTAGVRRMNLNELGIAFNGTSSSAVPIGVQLVRCTAATASPTSPAIIQAPTPLDSAAPSSGYSAYAPTAAASLWTAVTAPTAGAILRTWYVPPTSGLVVQFPLGQEPDGPATTNSGLGIQVTAPGAAVGVTAYMVWTE